MRARRFVYKAGQQILKDYILFPVLAGPGGRQALTATLAANLIRNVWTNAVIFCGHFPDGAEKFTKQDLADETQAEWYLRQMLGSANLTGGPVIDFMSGNLSYQIEHHLYPDMPSNRLAEAAVRVRTVCDKYDHLPYVAGSLRFSTPGVAHHRQDVPAQPCSRPRPTTPRDQLGEDVRACPSRRSPW